MFANLALLFDYPAIALDLLLNGLLVGAVFALAAYGMALVWGVMNIINIVQGELVILGGYLAWLVAGAGFHPLFGIPVAAVGVGIIGWVMYRSVIRRIIEKDLFISILATFGMSILLQQLMNQVFGADVRTVESGLGSLSLADGMVTIAQVKLIAFGLALGTGLGLWLFLSRARLGQAIRATAQNPRAARVLGIDTDRTYAATYALNAALCGAAGGLVVMAWTIHPYIGLQYTVRAFMIVIVAGLGNVAGVVFSGLGLGALENMAGFVFGAEYQIAFVFLLMVLVLIVRNAWLAGQRKYLQ